MACGYSRTQAQPAKVPELSSMRGCQAGLSSLAPPSPVLGHPGGVSGCGKIFVPVAVHARRQCFRTAFPASFGFGETLDWIVRILECRQITDMRPQVLPFPIRRSRPGPPRNAARHRQKPRRLAPGGALILRGSGVAPAGLAVLSAGATEPAGVAGWPGRSSPCRLAAARWRGSCSRFQPRNRCP